MLHHAPGAGIVGGQGQGKVLFETIQAALKKLNTAFDIFLDIKGIFHPKGSGSFGHELHETHGPFRGNRQGVKT